MKNTILAIMIAVVSQYAPGVMDRVIDNRQAGRTIAPLPQELPAVDGYIAVYSCADIGKTMLLRGPGQDWETFLVTDCAKEDNSDGTQTWMKRKNIVAEVDYETAVRWGIVGKLAPVEVGIRLVGPGIEP